MSTIRNLKNEYNLMTGDDLLAKPKPADDHRVAVERWGAAKKYAFQKMAPAALCIVATDGPVSVVTYDAAGQITGRFGHNRGCWPVRLATTSIWADRISEAYDRNPFVHTGVQIRTWASNARKRDRLAESITGLLAQMSEDAMGARLINGFVDVGPDLQLELFEIEIHAIAERLGIGVWDDAGLSTWLDQIVEREERRRVGARCPCA